MPAKWTSFIVVMLGDRKGWGFDETTFPPLIALMDSASPDYRRLRWQVFAGIFVGYAAFYLVRNNLALAMPDVLKQHPEYTKAQLGSAMMVVDPQDRAHDGDMGWRARLGVDAVTASFVWDLKPGEISDVMREVFSTYQEPAVF